jgi:hypothetical protein
MVGWWTTGRDRDPNGLDLIALVAIALERLGADGINTMNGQTTEGIPVDRKSWSSRAEHVCSIRRQKYAKQLQLLGVLFHGGATPQAVD